MTEPPTIISTLDSRPDYAAALGIICAEWANIEWQMFHFYTSVSGAPPALARATFGSLESNRARVEMILACCKTVVPDKNDITVIDGLLTRIRRTAGNRNKAVHDLWCVADTPQREVMQLRLSAVDGSQCVEGIALKDLQALAQRIRDLAGELVALRERITPKIQASLEKLRRQQGLGLVFAPKGHPPGRKPKGFHSLP